jgi:hypothetical protein
MDPRASIGQRRPRSAEPDDPDGIEAMAAALTRLTCPPRPTGAGASGPLARCCLPSPATRGTPLPPKEQAILRASQPVLRGRPPTVYKRLSGLLSASGLQRKAGPPKRQAGARPTLDQTAANVHAHLRGGAPPTLAALLIEDE